MNARSMTPSPPAVLAVEREQRLHQALHDRRVAADAHLVVDGGDLRRAPGQHLDRMLRRQEALQAALLQRVEHHDGAAALGDVAQRRTACADDWCRGCGRCRRRGRHGRSLRASPCPCRRRWNPAGRRWSPRGTCWSSRGNCWCRTRARTAGRGTPLRSRCGPRCRTPPCSGSGRLAQLLADAREGVVPGDGHEVVASPRRRSSDASGGRRLPGRSRSSLHSSETGVRGEELEVGALARRFPGHRLGAVLAELER